MSRLRFLSRIALAVVFAACAGSLAAFDADQTLTADEVRVADDGGSVSLQIALRHPAPWKLHTLAKPARLVLDVAGVGWSETPQIVTNTISGVRVGAYRPGWSRMVLLLREPLAVDTAEMRTGADGGAELTVVLRPTTAEDFRRDAGVTETESPAEIAPPPGKSGVLRVAIDPGHGGIDPGAEHGGLVEAEVILSFARGLKDKLLRTGRFEVVLTREEDVFVPLEERLRIARAAGADVFVSLHADALVADAEEVSGVTAYTLSDDRSDAAALQLAERHAANEILAGVDLEGVGDDVALALIDLAQRTTTPRSEALAGMLVRAMGGAGLETNTRPHRHGGFSVLKSADIPSVLLEIGYLSHPDDRARLSSPEWQGEAQDAVVDALLLWWEEDNLRGDPFRR